MFKIGDWVKISLMSDFKWSRWYNNLDIYSEFMGRIGCITDISVDEDDSSIKTYAVTVNFKDGFLYSPPGEYFEYFKSDHLIKSSEYDAMLQENMYEAGHELQEWENFKKKSTNDMLKHIFGPQEKQKNENFNKKIENYDENIDDSDGYFDYERCFSDD